MLQKFETFVSNLRLFRDLRDLRDKIVFRDI